MKPANHFSTNKDMGNETVWWNSDQCTIMYMFGKKLNNCSSSWSYGCPRNQHPWRCVQGDFMILMFFFLGLLGVSPTWVIPRAPATLHLGSTDLEVPSSTWLLAGSTATLSKAGDRPGHLVYDRSHRWGSSIGPWWTIEIHWRWSVIHLWFSPDHRWSGILKVSHFPTKVCAVCAVCARLSRVVTENLIII